MTVTQFFLSIHLLAIAAGFGIGISNVVGFRVAKTLGGDMAKGIATHRETLIPYMDGIFVTILATGFILLWAIGGAQGLNGWFHVKMAAVVVWAVIYVLMRLRIRTFLASRDMTLVPLIRRFAHVMLTAVAVAIVCAVMAFAA